MSTRILLTVVLCLAAAPLVAAQEKSADPVAKALADSLAIYAKDGVEKAILHVGRIEPPRLAAVVHLRLSMELYWKKKDLAGVVAVARAGIRHGMDEADKLTEKPEEAMKLRGVVKAIAYNLASFTWPGWGNPEIRIEDQHLVIGLKAARLSLDLGRALEQPPEAISAAYWVLGAQLLASGHHEAAIEAFRKAEEKATEAGSRDGAAMSSAYAALVRLLDGAAAAREGYEAALKVLDDMGTADATYYAGQIRKARTVFEGRAAGGRAAYEKRVHCGPLTLDVTIALGANLFHVVDHLSGWSRDCHTQYRRSIELTKEDRKLLAAYAVVRKAKGWGGGLEKAFYTKAGMDEALFKAAETGVLAAKEVGALREALAAFADRVKALYDAQRPRLVSFAKGLAKIGLDVPAKKLATFCGVPSITVPLYPILNPGKAFGGGYNGGRLTVEVPADQNVTAVVVHEIAHAFLAVKKDDLAALAKRTPGLDAETLTEAIAYAFAQGLHHGVDGDPLADRVRAHAARGEGLDDPKKLGRFRLYALALRPVLAEALKEGTLADFLPRARDVWLALSEVEAAK